MALLAGICAATACSEGGGTGAAPVSVPVVAKPAPVVGLMVEVVGERVSIRCSDTLAAEVLERLAEEAGFVLAPGARPAARVRLDLNDVRTEEVLVHLLAGLPYAIEYESDARGRPRIARVRVAESDGPPVVERTRKMVKARPRERPREERPPERPDPPRRWTPGDEEALEEELVVRLDSRDPEIRADALTELDADSSGMERLAVIALEDPHTSVRLAAIEHLEGEDAWAAVNVLIKALDDDDPAVVARAVEAIGALGDETLLPTLAALQDHRDPRVREAVGEAVEFLE